MPMTHGAGEALSALGVFLGVALVPTVLGLAQLLGAPLWLLSFVLFAFLTPRPQAHRMLVAAIGIEVVVGACAVFHWFLRGPRT